MFTSLSCISANLSLQIVGFAPSLSSSCPNLRVVESKASGLPSYYEDHYLSPAKSLLVSPAINSLLSCFFCFHVVMKTSMEYMGCVNALAGSLQRLSLTSLRLKRIGHNDVPLRPPTAPLSLPSLTELYMSDNQISRMENLQGYDRSHFLIIEEKAMSQGLTDALLFMLP